MKPVKTPFYPLHKEYTKRLEYFEKTCKEDVVLVKHDTGWRIK